MLKLIWISDPHYTHEGKVLGHDPRVRLQAAITYINEHHSDAAYCICSGDMVNRGIPTDYASLAKQFEALTIPLLPMVGNHDDRGMLRNVLPLPEHGMDSFVQYAIPTSEAVICCLDTQKYGSDAGEFCPKRREWLHSVLAEVGQKPVILFMHHPPFPLGLPMQDTDRMEEGDAFLNLASQYGNVSYMGIGHVHRPITGTVRGIPFATMRSILYQAPPPQPAWDWDTFAPAREAPDLGVMTIDGSAITMQYQQICDASFGVDT